MKNLIIKGLFILSLLASHNVYASGEITCTTPRQSWQLVIKKVSVKINTKSPSRSISSETYTRTKVQGNGFTKITHLNGKKWMIHVEDQKNFSDVEDYLTIRSKEGHEITYPLNCQIL